MSIAMMIHPVPDGFSANPVGTTSQAAGRFRATFTGQAAHAAAAPHLGRNAADAATLANVAIGLLRQQLPDDHRVGLHTVTTGSATNIIPDNAVVDFECRAFSVDRYRDLDRRVRLCFDAAATATETSVDIVETEPLYEPLVHDDTLAEHWCAAVSTLGHRTDVAALPGNASTDMGNVSQRIPSIHPWVSIPGVTAPIHTRAFAEATATATAHATMLQAGLCLAWTVSAVSDDRQARRRYLNRNTSESPPSPE